MENIFTWKWLKAALVRAVKTIAQTAAATIGTAVMISEVDWRAVAAHQRGGAAGGAGEVGRGFPPRARFRGEAALRWKRASWQRVRPPVERAGKHGRLHRPEAARRRRSSSHGSWSAIKALSWASLP